MPVWDDKYSAKLGLIIITEISHTVLFEIVGKEIFKYPISGSEKYQNEFPNPK